MEMPRLAAISPLFGVITRIWTPSRRCLNVRFIIGRCNGILVTLWYLGAVPD